MRAAPPHPPEHSGPNRGADPRNSREKDPQPQAHDFATSPEDRNECRPSMICSMTTKLSPRQPIVLEQTRGQHEGEHELCCTSGRCVKCEEIRNEAEAHLKQTLLKVAPHPFRMAGDHSARPLAETEAQTTLPVASAPAARIGAAEYLRRFFLQLEELKATADLGCFTCNQFPR